MNLSRSHGRELNTKCPLYQPYAAATLIPPPGPCISFILFQEEKLYPHSSTLHLPVPPPHTHPTVHTSVFSSSALSPEGTAASPPHALSLSPRPPYLTPPLLSLSLVSLSTHQGPAAPLSVSISLSLCVSIVSRRSRSRSSWTLTRPHRSCSPERGGQVRGEKGRERERG